MLELSLAVRCKIAYKLPQCNENLIFTLEYRYWSFGNELKSVLEILIRISMNLDLFWLDLLDRAAAVRGSIFSLGVKLESEFGKIRWIWEASFTSKDALL
jgi:hypothetical protein